jgi:UDP-GlcNAc:undecaprenyl-phosphate/decaprenyl-phosphate GlcNAc-1-phosphate transferase
MKMSLQLMDLVPVLLSLMGVVTLTPLVRAAAQRRGFVARPKTDRWHTQPTALLGGVAIFASVVGVGLCLVPLSPQARVILGTSAFFFLLGQVDDLVGLKPLQKLIGQSLGSVVVIAFGLVIPCTGSTAIDAAISLLWLVGITNAVNLLDNMDGLAAGIAAIASVFLALIFFGNGQTADALLLAVFGSALVGFLVYNANPASIFMGDCGSMFVGFFLAATALLIPLGGRPRGFLTLIAVPALILLIPIFDTFFVIVLRTLAGRPIARGGRDHTSHRLVALGMSERHAVWMLYGFAAVSGLLSLLVQDLPLAVGLPVLVIFMALPAVFGVYLARAKVYDEAEIRTVSTWISKARIFAGKRARRRFGTFYPAGPAADRSAGRMGITPAATRFS